MRRLLIRLLAVETALVGWLAYWIFLLYATNDTISQGLASQLAKFPQLSFTTVDIAILTIVAGLAIFLAFKFQRGLRPGIRLERALQMLEGMMKRNLVLEAQVAELRMEKVNVDLPSPVRTVSEPRQGSWERAFRTPIEAGQAPAYASTPASRPGLSKGADLDQDHEFHGQPEPGRSGLPPAPQAQSDKRAPTSERFEKHFEVSPKTPALTKPPAKPQYAPGSGGSTSWEDFASKGAVAVAGRSTVPRSLLNPPRESGLREPYIPVPVPKVPAPVPAAEPATLTRQADAKPSSSLQQQGESPRQPSPTLSGVAASRNQGGNVPKTLVPVGYASPRSSSRANSLVETSSEKAELADELSSARSKTREVEEGGQSSAARERSDEERKAGKGSEKTLKRYKYEED